MQAGFFPGSGSIKIKQNLTGEISLPTLPETNLIQIGGGLVTRGCPEPDSTITVGRILVPVGMLVGQVVINANWTGPGEPANPGGLWSGHVQDEPGTAYDITLYNPVCNIDRSPYYYRASAFLGGGAAGLVPYHLHHADCEPADETLPPSCLPADGCDMVVTARAWPDGVTRQTIVLRHYGRVLNTASSMPVRVWRASASNSCAPAPNCSGWTNVSSLWTYVVAPFGAEREVWLARTSGSIDRRFQYLVEPVRSTSGATQLRSDETFAPYAVPPAPYWQDFANVEGYPYRLRACNGSSLAAMMDLNASGDVEVGDIGEWLSEPADFTFDDLSNGEDLDLLAATVLNGGTPPDGP
jgi:hypothetical protein